MKLVIVRTHTYIADASKQRVSRRLRCMCRCVRGIRQTIQHTYHIDFNKLNFKNARLVKLVYTADSKSVP